MATYTSRCYTHRPSFTAAHAEKGLKTRIMSTTIIGLDRDLPKGMSSLSTASSRGSNQRGISTPAPPLPQRTVKQTSAQWQVKLSWFPWLCRGLEGHTQSVNTSQLGALAFKAMEVNCWQSVTLSCSRVNRVSEDATW